MTLSLLFWVIVIVGLVFSWLGYANPPTYGRYASVPLFVLVIILGFAVFGFHLSR